MRTLLQAYLSNFIKPEALASTDDIIAVDYLDRDNQVANDELGIGTSTRLLLCGELEDGIMGTAVERNFFLHVRAFYEASVSKMLAKFPFSDNTLKELAFLSPCHRSKTTVTGIINLAHRFTSFSSDDIDNLIMEFRDYRAASDNQLQNIIYNEDVAAIDH